MGTYLRILGVHALAVVLIAVIEAFVTPRIGALFYV
jgi:hypothetical protein